MKKYLLNILLFFVLVLILFVGTDILVSKGLRKADTRLYAVWNDIYNSNNLENDLVLLGSSACMVEFNPDIIDSALGLSSYNLGIDGHSWFPFQQLRYDTYLRYATKKPKCVIIVIDNATFEEDTNPYQREQIFPYFWIDDSLVTSVQQCMEYTLMERYFPMWRYIGYQNVIKLGITSWMGKKNQTRDVIQKGYIGSDAPWNRASLDILDTIQIKADSKVVDKFIRFIKEREAEGQVVVLVNRVEYYELQERYTNRAEMVALYDSIAKETGTELIDYWDYPMKFNTKYFYNSTHLNLKGSELLSKQLVHDLDSLGINGNKLMQK